MAEDWQAQLAKLSGIKLEEEKPKKNFPPKKSRPLKISRRKITQRQLRLIILFHCLKKYCRQKLKMLRLQKPH